MSETRTCAECGAAFEVRFASIPTRCCSRSCGIRFGMGRRDGEHNGRWAGGKTKHPLYEVYTQIIGRCENPRHARWKDYGGRGISICPAWRADFWQFVKDVGERPEGLTLDRIDNDGNYEPGNIRWATYREQVINRRTSGWENRTRNQKGRFT